MLAPRLADRSAPVEAQADLVERAARRRWRSPSSGLVSPSTFSVERPAVRDRDRGCRRRPAGRRPGATTSWAPSVDALVRRGRRRRCRRRRSRARSGRRRRGSRSCSSPRSRRVVPATASTTATARGRASGGLARGSSVRAVLRARFSKGRTPRASGATALPRARDASARAVPSGGCRHGAAGDACAAPSAPVRELPRSRPTITRPYGSRAEGQTPRPIMYCFARI